MPTEPPAIIGDRYELIRSIAPGGMAHVYLANDQRLARQVAVKVLFAQYATDARFVERFRREARAAAALNHGNITGIYDWGEDDGNYFIAMEYVDGSSLADVLRQEGRLSARAVIHAVTQIATALGFAHENGVVHRDVKPGNVLVAPNGVMKVADFGIATALTANASANLTQTGAVMGTATYLSPEQAQGLPVDDRSDLYSLGVVMYELLVGKPPFTGGTPVSLGYRHVQEDPVPVGNHGVDVPPALAAITMRLLSKNPDDRYASANTLLVDLQRAQQGQPVAAGVASGAGVAASPGLQTQDLARQPQATQVFTAVGPDESPGKRSGTGNGILLVGALLGLLVIAGIAILVRSTTGSQDAADGVVTADATSVVEAAEPTTDPETEPDDQDPDDQGPDGVNGVAIPDLVGESRAVVERFLQDEGLVNNPAFSVVFDESPPNTVLAIDPPPGTVVAEGATVTLTLSAGPAPTAVAAAPDPTAPAEPTAVPEPTATVEPTAVPEPTATVEPTPEPTATVEPTPEPEPTATVEPTPEPTVGSSVPSFTLDAVNFSDQEFRISLTNTGDQARTMVTVQISFPEGSVGALVGIARGGAQLYTSGGVSSPATIGASAWSGDASSRTVGASSSARFDFGFADQPDSPPAGFVVTFTFDDGSSITVRGA